jgi:UDP-N-acetylmuramyl pentapeptide phosphotransferase/UDP-N-acetylglucosamine-1-phosphate transferase
VTVVSATIAFVVAAVVAGGLWYALEPLFAAPALTRRNWHDRAVPTAGGLVLVLAVVLVEAGWVVVDGPAASRTAVAVAVVGLGLLGTVDDLLGDGSARGFRGHLAALRRGRLTTGLVKLGGGAAVGVVACGLLTGSRGQLVADAALVALAANLGNLLDRAPGRVVKAGLVAFGVLVIATAEGVRLGGVAVAAGAAAGLLLPDVRERMMLGDAGANALGGAIGIGVVVACAPGTRMVWLVVVAALNLAAELVSFSRVIEAVPPLRAADRWGRPA